MNYKEELTNKMLARTLKKDLDRFCLAPEYHQALRELCLSDDLRLNWQAAWVLSNFPQTELANIFPDPEILIERLHYPSPKDGYWREVLKVLAQLNLNEDQEGLLYEAALKLWEDLALASSVRIFALRAMFRVAQNYPELEQELLAYFDDHYFQGVSPGIANQMRKLFSSLG